MRTTPKPNTLSLEDLDAMRSRDAACVPEGPRWNLNNSVDHNDAAHAVRDRHKLFEHVAALGEHIEALRSSCREHHEAKGAAYAQLKSTEAALAQVVKERAEEKAAADRLRGQIATELGFYPPQGDDHLVAQVANTRSSLTTASKMRDQAFDALQRVGELVNAPGGSSYFDAPKYVEVYKLEREKAAHEASIALGNLDARVQELAAKHREAADCAATFERACERMAKTIEERDATIRELRERCDRDDQGVTIHECPPEGSSEMPCCGKSPLEVLGHRMTRNAQHVNCDRLRLKQETLSHSFDECEHTRQENAKAERLRGALMRTLGYASLTDDEIVAKVRALDADNTDLLTRAQNAEEDRSKYQQENEGLAASCASLLRDRFPARETAPLQVLILCPKCSKPHIDEGEWALKPHKTHRCVDDAAGKGCCAEWEMFGLTADSVPVCGGLIDALIYAYGMAKAFLVTNRTAHGFEHWDRYRTMAKSLREAAIRATTPKVDASAPEKASTPADKLNPLGRAVVELARAFGWYVIEINPGKDNEEILCRPRQGAEHFRAMAGCTDAVWAYRALEMLLKDLAAPPAGA